MSKEAQLNLLGEFREASHLDLEGYVVKVWIHPQRSNRCTNFANVSPGFGQLPPLGQIKRLCPQGGSHVHNHLAVQVEDGPRFLVGERKKGIEHGE